MQISPRFKCLFGYHQWENGRSIDAKFLFLRKCRFCQKTQVFSDYFGKWEKSHFRFFEYGVVRPNRD